MREIAARAGLSVGGLYIYFKSKETLYRELMSEQRTAFEKEALPLREESPPYALRAYIQRNLEFALRRKELVSLYLKENDVTFMGPFRKTFFGSQKQLMEDILRAGVEQGSFTIKDCEHMALVILFAIRGAITSYFTRSVADVDQLCDSLCSLVTVDGAKEGFLK